MDDTALTPDRARVLLVDDDHSVRASIRRVLARADLHVVEAGSGDAAVALIEQAAPFDMLLTDVRMPGSVDGVALASYWREGAGPPAAARFRRRRRAVRHRQPRPARGGPA